MRQNRDEKLPVEDHNRWTVDWTCHFESRKFQSQTPRPPGWHLAMRGRAAYLCLNHWALKLLHSYCFNGTMCRTGNTEYSFHHTETWRKFWKKPPSSRILYDFVRPPIYSWFLWKSNHHSCWLQKTVCDRASTMTVFLTMSAMNECSGKGMPQSH